jgi:hypothetical protein
MAERLTINQRKQESKKFIWVTFQLEGIHKFPAAATDPSLADVRFLSYEHRHLLHFKVAIQVWQNDRDIEFIQFKRWLLKLYGSETLHLDYLSMEMIAENLFDEIANKYPNREVVIDVAEDGENGCSITFPVIT